MMLTIGNKTFSQRLILGTGKFGSSQQMLDAVVQSETEMVTLALKRVQWDRAEDDIVNPLLRAGVQLLPNTSGARNAKEAVFAAKLAKEALGCDWVKLEIHPDPRYLMPDPIETLAAATLLCREGFTVLPYVHADPVLCKRLEEVGCAAVMPLASPIGSNLGLQTEPFLSMIIEQSAVPVIVDAGIGRPSDAVRAMELGADALIVNTAIASSPTPALMAAQFRDAVRLGYQSAQAGLGPQGQMGHATSPMEALLATL